MKDAVHNFLSSEIKEHILICLIVTKHIQTGALRAKTTLLKVFHFFNDSLTVPDPLVPARSV